MYRGDYNKVLSSPGQGGLERGSDSAQRAAQEVGEPDVLEHRTGLPEDPRSHPGVLRPHLTSPVGVPWGCSRFPAERRPCKSRLASTGASGVR